MTHSKSSTKALPVKHPDKTHARTLTNGQWSERVAEIQKRINACPLREVQKMELKSMLEDMTAKSLAFDIDVLIKSKIVDNIKDYDSRVLSYQADMIDTQRKLADQESSLAFHKKVLLDLKEQYSTASPEDKPFILEQIDAREDSIRKTESMYNTLLDLRTKMRKELDKAKYMDKSMQIQEEEHSAKMSKNIINVNDLDLTEDKVE